MNAPLQIATRVLSYADAFRDAMDLAMAADERVFLMGEDIGVYDGVAADL